MPFACDAAESHYDLLSDRKIRFRVPRIMLSRLKAELEMLDETAKRVRT